jgi:hypothetical protein
LAENETDHDLDVETHVPPPEFDENAHISGNQDRDEDLHLNFSSEYSFSESLFQDQVCQNEIYETACIKSLGSETILDDNYPELQENSEEEQVVLDPSDGTQIIHYFTSFELVNSKFLKGKNNTLVEVHEESFFIILVI